MDLNILLAKFILTPFFLVDLTSFRVHCPEFIILGNTLQSRTIDKILSFWKCVPVKSMFLALTKTFERSTFRWGSPSASLLTTFIARFRELVMTFFERGCTPGE